MFVSDSLLPLLQDQKPVPTPGAHLPRDAHCRIGSREKEGREMYKGAAGERGNALKTMNRLYWLTLLSVPAFGDSNGRLPGNEH